MRFLKGIHYPHPPRGPGRGSYHVSDAAQRARRHNLSKARLRSDRESWVIKLLIWIQKQPAKAAGERLGGTRKRNARHPR